MTAAFEKWWTENGIADHVVRGIALAAWQAATAAQKERDARIATDYRGACKCSCPNSIAHAIRSDAGEG
jgi:hypothetical protein